MKTRTADNTMYERQKVARLVVEYRAIHGLNQEQFGRLCSLNRSTIYRIENELPTSLTSRVLALSAAVR